MSNFDPIVFAAHACSMSDTVLYDVLHDIAAGQAPSDLQQAALDEAQHRGMLSASEASAIASRPAWSS